MKNVNIILLQLMIVILVTMSVVDTAKFINDQIQFQYQTEKPVLVAKKILKSRNDIKANPKSQSDQEKIFSYNTLLRCWNIITEDQ